MTPTWRLMPLLSIACSEPSPSGNPSEDTASTGSSPLPDLPAGGCGAPAYDWYPLDTMGELVSAEEDASLSLSADTIDLLLDSQGLADLAPVPYGVRTFRVRYITQDRGEPVEATGLVIVPDVDTETTFPSLLWLHFTVGFSDACAPSGLGLEGAAFPILWASHGYSVAAPDYLGMNGWGAPSDELHPYIIAEPTAVASLDAVRAMMNLVHREALPAQPDPQRLIHWGASEGGFAALWTDRYQPHYAPEFHTVGVVATVPVTDPPADAAHAASVLGPTSVALAAAMVTMQRWYGETTPLTDVLTSEVASQLPDEMASSCDEFPVISHAESVEDIFTSEWISATETKDSMDPWSCYLEQGRLRTSDVPREDDAPVFVITGENDDLTLAGPVDADIPRLCDQGYVIQHIECAGDGHTEAAVHTLPLQLQWTLDRANGVALDNSNLCEVSTPVACTDPIGR